MKPQSVLNKVVFLLVNLTDNCILYPFTNGEGYGHIQYRNKKGKKERCLAHRLAYEVHNNIELTPEQLILHSCDIPNCINPNHLRIGTHKDNSDDKVSRNRQAKGTNNGRYKTGYNSKFAPIEKPKTVFSGLCGRSLDENKAKELKLAIANKGNKTLKILSEEIGVKYQTLRDLNIGRIYKDV